MRMNKKIFAILVFAAAISGAGILFFNDQRNAPKNGAAQVCVKNNCYNVEVADDSIERARGLMFRKSLAENEGMLFVFGEEAKHSFWMKNTLIHLDILWMNSAGEIVGISENTPPCEADPCPSYVPEGPAKYALEIAAGQAQKIGARIGDDASVKF